MQKEERHNLIISIITAEKVSTQEDLKSFLLQKGLDITQATISRDIQEIPLVKRGGYYCYEPERLAAEMLEHVLSIKTAPPNMLVIRTSVGWAQPIGATIDRYNIDGIAGNVAGVDTILIVVENLQTLKMVSDKLTKIFEGAKATEASHHEEPDKRQAKIDFSPK